MRVALVAPLFESVPPRLYGGTERVVYNLCRGLTEADVQVTLFASGDSSAEGKLVPVIPEALRLSRAPTGDHNVYNFKMLAQIANRAEEFDIIHNHHDYWMLPLSTMTDLPLLTTLHGRLDIENLDAAFASYPDARFVSISDSQRGPLAKKLHWAKTIRHGIDTESFQFQEGPGQYLAFLGRIDPTKRPDLAIQIAHESGVPLKIAAKIDTREMQEYYDALIKPHVDGRFIEYVGEISEGEKQDFLGQALALVFPIDWPEPFGLVMIEALACGTPVLARPLGAAPEVLMDGVTGYSSLDVSVLAKKVKDAARLDRRICRRWVEERFSLKRMTEDYIHVYRQLIRVRGESHRHRRHFLHPVEQFADGNT